MRMPIRATAAAVIATVVLMGGLLTGVVARRGERVWTTVRPGVVLPADLSALVHQTINADGGAAYAIAPDAGDPAIFVAANPAQGFEIAFTPEGARIAGASPLTLRLAAFGRVDDRRGVAMATWRPEGLRIEREAITHDISEWYINGPLGLEQGFTVSAPPPGRGPLSIELALDPAWLTEATDSPAALRLRHETGLTWWYAGLHSVDAAGRPLPSRLRASTHGIVIDVDTDVGTSYPVTVDPFISQQTLSAFDGQLNDRFGTGLALSGNTAVIGAPGLNGNFGAAYVFVRSGATWSLQSKLVPNDPSDKAFGRAVAISGNTIVVGAPEDATQAIQQGSAYVFVRTGSLWSQQARLAPPNGQQNRFGTSVSIDGETVAIGAQSRNGAQLFSGAVLVYVRSGTTWTLQQQLVASDGVSGAMLGAAVDLEGDLILAGAPGTTFSGVPLTGAAYVFERVMLDASTAFWFERQKLTGTPPLPLDRFGVAVALSGSRALIAQRPFSVNELIPGAGILYSRSGSTLTPAARIETSRPVSFPGSVALDGSQVALSGSSQIPGETFVLFVRIQPGGGLQTQPVSQNGAGISFGAGLALDAGQLLVGDPSTGTAGEVFVMAEQTTAPSAPVLSSPQVSGSTVDLSWTVPAGTTSFRLRAGTSPGSTNAFNGDVGDVTTLKAVNVPNGSYFIRVSAVNAFGEGVASNEVRADVGVPGPCSAPASPANLTRSVNGSLVSLTWNASTGATTYVVEAGSASGLANLANIDTGSATPGLLANAPPGLYFVRVRAKNACGLSGPSNQVTVQVN